MEDKKQLLSKIAHLESRLDQSETEISFLDELLVRCGFSQGIDTLKTTIEDLLAEAEKDYSNYPIDPEEFPPTQTFDFF